MLRAAVLHRSEASFDWLCDVAAKGDKTSAKLVIQELAVYRANKALRERLGKAVANRGDPVLQQAFDRGWNSPGD